MNAKTLESIARSVVHSSRAVSLPTPSSKRKIKVAIWIWFLLALLVPSHAATTVGGRVDGQIWTCEGSPYLVTGDVQVASLTILPGVVVQFQGNFLFEVTGWLRASGTEDARIWFTTTNLVGRWRGIHFSQVGPGSWLVYCNIQRATQGGIWIEQCVPEIQNCNIQGNTNHMGGGILVSNTLPGQGELVISGCNISGNTSLDVGAGILALMGQNRLKLVNCHIEHNVANPGRAANNTVYGGGVYVDGDSVFLHCYIRSNGCWAGATTAGYSDGGGVFSASGDALFRNCEITGNTNLTFTSSGGPTRYANGGGVFVDTGTLTSINCFIVSNVLNGSSGADGAGIFVDNPVKAHIENCTIAYNNVDGLRGSGGSNTVVLNSIIWGNNGNVSPQLTGTTNITYTDVQGTNWPGTGNINLNPNFAEDLRISCLSSPCVDAGDPRPIYNDLCFPPSCGTPINDMGKDGGPGACCWSRACEPAVEVVGHPGTLMTCGTVREGESFSLCAAAAGEPPSYQWYRNGRVVSTNGTNACLVITNASADASGYYRVIVSNALGIATSAPFSVMVVRPPLIVRQPRGGLFCAGNQVELTVEASGAPPLFYQWYFSGLVTNTNCALLPTNFVALAEATNANLVLSSVQSNNQGAYYAVVWNAYGAASSEAVTVLVAGPHCTEISLYAGVKISNGVVDREYLIQYTMDPTQCPAQWITLLSTNLPSSDFLWIDPDPASRARKFYRAIEAP
jgi:hypothetical protein